MLTKNALQLLSELEADRFQSGQVLADKLGISRTMVWKHINQLKEEGLEIISQRNEGYRLLRPFIPLDLDKIRSMLTCHRELDLHLVSRVSSTNDLLMQLENPEKYAFQALTAEQQTSGRGRRGRTWLSPYGSNIYLSIRFTYQDPLSNLFGLSPLIGLTCLQTIESWGIEGLGIKWPNDLFLDNRKVGGVLVELSGEFGSNCDVVIGIGLNVNMQADKTNIDQPWTSLSFCTEAPLDRNRLLADLLNNLIAMLKQYSSRLLAERLSLWNKWDIYKGKSIELLMGSKTERGLSEGINGNGELVIRQPCGKIKCFSVGEISIKK